MSITSRKRDKLGAPVRRGTAVKPEPEAAEPAEPKAKSKKAKSKAGEGGAEKAAVVDPSELPPAVEGETELPEG